MVGGNESKLWLWRHMSTKCRKLFNNNMLLFLYTLRDYDINPETIDPETIDCADISTFLESLRNYRKSNGDVDSMELMQILHDVESIERLKDIDADSVPAIIDTIHDIITKIHNINVDNIANLRMRKLNYIIERLL